MGSAFFCPNEKCIHCWHFQRSSYNKPIEWPKFMLVIGEEEEKEVVPLKKVVRKRK